MNKSELIDFIAGKTDLTKTNIEAVIAAFGDALLEVVKKGDSFSWIGLFTLSVKNRAARTGRNPATGKSIEIPAAIVPMIKVGTKLKEAANNKK
jgi:DNA-binding protein HU-beta